MRFRLVLAIFELGLVFHSSQIPEGFFAHGFARVLLCFTGILLRENGLLIGDVLHYLLH